MAEQCRKLFYFTHQSVPFRFKTAITSSLSPSLTSILLYIICFNPSPQFLLHPLSIATIPSLHPHHRYAQKKRLV
jgi:hypothetical protein